MPIFEYPNKVAIFEGATFGMNAIRKITTVNGNILKVELPEEFRNQTVEVIVLTTDEIVINKVSEPNTQYGKKYYGSMKLGLSADEIDEQLKALRSEWDRDIS